MAAGKRFCCVVTNRLIARVFSCLGGIQANLFCVPKAPVAMVANENDVLVIVWQQGGSAVILSLFTHSHGPGAVNADSWTGCVVIY